MTNETNRAELTRIAALLDKTFNGPAWHGPSIIEALKDVPTEKVFKNTSGLNSIIELVLHMATWRNFTSKRLMGNNTYEVTETDNFPKPTDWESAVNHLKKSQEELTAVLKAFPEEKLFTQVPTRSYDFYTLLHGIIQHDIYHCGQIILLKKL